MSLLERTLETLERSRRAGAPAAIEEALRDAARAEPESPATLVRLHDALLFHRAHPRSRAAIALAERALRKIPAHVARFAREGFDLSELDAPEAAGIGGSTISMPFSYPSARWLAARFPRSLSIDWNVQDTTEGLERVLPRLFPLLSDEALVEMGVHYREWLDAVRPRGASELPWLLSRIQDLGFDERTTGLLYDTLAFQVSWRLATGTASRTLARWRFRPSLLDETLVRHASIAEELARPPRLRRLSAGDGARALDLCRSVVLCRYRELYAFTFGDARAVWETDLGRGAGLLVCGIAPGRRLPLRAGFGFVLLRNGVPVGYGDAYSFGGKLDVSFNVFYAFRDGESAFLYARLLSALRALTGAKVFRADPYQLGRGNEEAITSGAFFFYRRLGFVSADPGLEALARSEEKRRGGRPEHRTSAAVLKKLAEAAVLWSADEGLARRWAKFSPLQLARNALGKSPETAGLREVLASAGISPTAIRKLAAAKEARDEVGYCRLFDERLADLLLRAGS